VAARSSLNVVEVTEPGERSRICASILRAVPEWFGIESATLDYIQGVADLPTFVAGNEAGEAAGFLSLKLHTARATEIWVMAVMPGLHRRGIGRSLIEAAEQYLRDRGFEFLQVKTLGPTHPSERYRRTRSFYEGVGFAALEEIHGLWGPSNPCLLMVKALRP
jgi:GNAT superfamily N-acetyltransferase